MFVVLQPREVTPRRRFLQRRPPRQPPSIRICRASNSMPFYILGVPLSDGQADWELLRQYAGGCASRALLPMDFTLPPGCGLSEYFPSRFIARCVLKTAAELIRESGIPPQGLTIGIDDKRGLFSSEVCRLLRHASTLKIVTADRLKYREAARLAMERYGASLFFADGATPTGEGLVISSVEARSPDGLYSILSCGKGQIKARFSLCGSPYEVPELKGIDGAVFAGALAELCARSDLYGAVFNELYFQGRAISRREAAELIRGADVLNT